MRSYICKCVDQLSNLTAREHEVSQLLAQGAANKMIAFELGISQRTVEAHRSRIFRKLSVRNAIELAHLLWMGQSLQCEFYQLAEPQPVTTKARNH